MKTDELVNSITFIGLYGKYMICTSELLVHEKVTQKASPYINIKYLDRWIKEPEVTETVIQEGFVMLDNNSCKVICHPTQLHSLLMTLFQNDNGTGVTIHVNKEQKTM